MCPDAGGGRRLIAELLSCLVVRDALQATAVEAGLELVLKQLPDLVIDIPKVRSLVCAVSARALICWLRHLVLHARSMCARGGQARAVVPLTVLTPHA